MGEVGKARPFRSVHFDFVDDLGYPYDPGYHFLGQLLMVEAGQAVLSGKARRRYTHTRPSLAIRKGCLEEAP